MVWKKCPLWYKNGVVLPKKIYSTQKYCRRVGNTPLLECNVAFLCLFASTVPTFKNVKFSTGHKSFYATQNCYSIHGIGDNCSLQTIRGRKSTPDHLEKYSLKRAKHILDVELPYLFCIKFWYVYFLVLDVLQRF